MYNNDKVIYDAFLWYEDDINTRRFTVWAANSCAGVQGYYHDIVYHEHASSYLGMSITRSTNLDQIYISQFGLTNGASLIFSQTNFQVFIASIISSIQKMYQRVKIWSNQIRFSHHGNDIYSKTYQTWCTIGNILFGHEISTADRRRLQKCTSSLVLPERNIHIWHYNLLSRT